MCTDGMIKNMSTRLYFQAHKVAQILLNLRERTYIYELDWTSRQVDLNVFFCIGKLKVSPNDRSKS
jgi:hypothetical protein